MKMKTSYRNQIISGRNAFTRIELSIGIAAVVLVLLVSATGLADTRSRSQRAGCVDNLRQIGQAVQLWAADHENNNPWLVPVQQGGTRQNQKVGNAWFEFLWLSNQLATPKILACPSDLVRQQNSADNWGQSPEGGYANPGVRGNRATSYIIGLHSSFTDPNSLLSSDRNLRVDLAGSAGCVTGVNNASAIFLDGPSIIAAWTNGLHQLAGNLLLSDGRVLETSNSGLVGYLHSITPNEDNVSPLHILIP
jgi:competence protein ComGC